MACAAGRGGRLPDARRAAGRRHARDSLARCGAHASTWRSSPRRRVPLPPDLRLALSPAHARRRLTLRSSASRAWRRRAAPLSVDPAGTTMSLSLAVSVVLTVLVRAGDLRARRRALCAPRDRRLGLALAVFGMAQHTTAPHTFYWTSSQTGGHAVRPVLNHSDFATWLVMALPLTAGYLIARLYSRQSRRTPVLSADLAEAFDNTAMWLTTAMRPHGCGACRGLVAVGADCGGGGIRTLWMLSSRADASGGAARGCWPASAPSRVAALAYANTNCRSRHESAKRSAGARRPQRHLAGDAADEQGFLADRRRRGRVRARHDRLPAVAARNVYFNHAHNEYLQMLAEGGVLLAIPAVAAAVAGMWRHPQAPAPIDVDLLGARGSRRADLSRSPCRASGKRAFAYRPTALLFAVLAAIALHRPLDR